MYKKIPISCLRFRLGYFIKIHIVFIYREDTSVKTFFKNLIILFRVNSKYFIDQGEQLEILLSIWLSG